MRRICWALNLQQLDEERARAQWPQPVLGPGAVTAVSDLGSSGAVSWSVAAAPASQFHGLLATCSITEAEAASVGAQF